MMLALNRKTATAKIDNFVPADFLDDLAREGLDPVIHGYKKGLADRFGVEADSAIASFLSGPETSDLLVGDLFFPSAGVCCYLKIGRPALPDQADASIANDEDIFSDPGAPKSLKANEVVVEVGELAPMGGTEGAHLNVLSTAVENNLSGKLLWNDKIVPQIARLKGRSIETPSEQDIELAGIVCDERLTDLLVLLKEKDSIVIDEFLSQSADQEEVEYFIDKLLDAQFLTEEIVVYDSDTGQPIIRAQDRSAIEQLAKAGIKTPSGKPISSDDVKRLALISPDNRPKMKPSWVAKIFLANSLFKIGLTNKDITVLESDEGGILLYCTYDAVPIVFYLTDAAPEEMSTHVFKDTLEDLANARVVLFSQQEVPEEFALSLSTFPAVAEVITIDSLDNINARLAELLDAIRGKAAHDALAPINRQTMVDIAGLAMQRLNAGD